MAVLAKPLNMAFTVREDKAEQFLNEKVDNRFMLNKFKKLKKCALLSGKSEQDQEVIFLSSKIKEFEKKSEN